MATANIAEDLTCPVCLEFYKDPRLLPCQHSLCKSCLMDLRTNKINDNDCELQCPNCRHLFKAMDETHIESLPKNFTLGSIICKFQESFKGDMELPCDVCEEGRKGKAIKKCLQCRFNYCRMCLEQLHPKRGALANHKIIHIMDEYADKQEHEASISAIMSSISENQPVATEIYDKPRIQRYCMSCEEMFTDGDDVSAEVDHKQHDTTEMQTALRKKKEEFEYILARLLEDDNVLEKALADGAMLIKNMETKVEEIKIELVHRFGELAEEVERRKVSAVKRIEEEMNMHRTFHEGRLTELKDLKAKSEVKIAALSKLSSETKDDASIFLMKMKELKDEIGTVLDDDTKRATLKTERDPSLPIELLMKEITANLMQDIYPSEKRHQNPGQNRADTDSCSIKTTMAIQITSIKKEDTVSADVEWVAVDQVDHYEISYFCDPGETVWRQNILENRCSLTNLRWDSEYIITVFAYLSDGKSNFDSTVFKTDPKVKGQNLVDTDSSSIKTTMEIQVTSIKIEETISADVEWVAVDHVDHYEISYLCDPGESVLRQNIVDNRCSLTNLRWDSEYIITVIAYLSDGKSNFDSTVFKTDPKVKDTNPAIMGISSKRLNMSINVTNIQRAGTMSAHVKWSTIYQSHYVCHQYEVSYQRGPHEICVLKNITKHWCELTNLQWYSKYAIKVTAQLEDGHTVYDETDFMTDPKVECFPMIVGEVCNRKIFVLDSFHEIEASDRTRNWVSFRKVGEFSGIVCAPVLEEALCFWTMTLELTIFEEGMINQIFLDFGILNYSDLAPCFGLSNNTKAYACSIFRKTERKVHLRFQRPSNANEYSYPLPLKLSHKEYFCFGFLYDHVNGMFAVMDCEDKDVLHIFHKVHFRKDSPIVFALCPYHTEVKMRVDINLNYELSTNENISSWMRKMYNF